MWAAVAGIKAKKYYEAISKTWGVEDTAAARRMYDDGEILSASHILFLTKDKSDADKVSVKRKADALRTQLTAANFADLARKNSQDPGSPGEICHRLSGVRHDILKLAGGRSRILAVLTRQIREVGGRELRPERVGLALDGHLVRVGLVFCQEEDMRRRENLAVVVHTARRGGVLHAPCLGRWLS